jgi:hypothetical protein
VFDQFECHDVGMRSERPRLPFAGVALAGLALAGLSSAVLALAGCGGGASVPAPTFTKTVELTPVSGTVTIELPGTTAFVSLSGPRQVPVGTAVDATAGVVGLTSEGAAPGSRNTGKFRSGRFAILQNPAAGGLTELRILDDPAIRARCASAPKALEFGRLLGDAHGQFQTEGAFSAATVRGTNWGVRDRCDGTVTVVRQGVVSVTDFARHTSVTVRAGQRYLARAK